MFVYLFYRLCDKIFGAVKWSLFSTCDSPTKTLHGVVMVRRIPCVVCLDICYEKPEFSARALDGSGENINSPRLNAGPFDPCYIVIAPMSRFAEV